MMCAYPLGRRHLYVNVQWSEITVSSRRAVDVIYAWSSVTMRSLICHCVHWLAPVHTLGNICQPTIDIVLN